MRRTGLTGVPEDECKPCLARQFFHTLKREGQEGAQSGGVRLQQAFFEAAPPGYTWVPPGSADRVDSHWTHLQGHTQEELLRYHSGLLRAFPIRVTSCCSKASGLPTVSVR